MKKSFEDIKANLVDLLNTCEVKLSNSDSLSSADYYKIATELNEAMEDAVAYAMVLGNDKRREELKS